jgi:hypothetical protein
MGNRIRLTDRKSAKVYDNVDPLSMNNPYEDPDAMHYDLQSKSTNNFEEDPDMRTEWKKDESAYDEEHNFLMPLDDVPSWWGSGPKMAMKKAQACLKIAEYIYPDGTDEFVDAQASDFMELPDKAVLATLKRMAIYDREPTQVDAALEESGDHQAITAPPKGGESEEEPKKEEDTEAKKAPEEEAPAEEPKKEEDTEASMDSDVEALFGGGMGGESADEAPKKEDAAPKEEEDEAPTDQDAESAIDREIQAALEEKRAEASINPASELGDFFSHDASIEDLGNVTASSELEAVFTDQYSDPSRLRKSASRDNGNVKLSEIMGDTVPKAAGSNVGSLWDMEPSVEDAFK